MGQKVIYLNKVIEIGGKYYFTSHEKMGEVLSVSEDTKSMDVQWADGTKETLSDALNTIKSTVVIVDNTEVYCSITSRVAEKMGIPIEKFKKDPTPAVEEGTENIPPVEEEMINAMSHNGDIMSIYGEVTFPDELGEDPVFILLDPTDDKLICCNVEAFKEKYVIEEIVSTTLAMSGNWSPTPAIVKELNKQIITLLTEYKHKASFAGVQKNLEVWAQNKAGLANMMSKHPGWNPDKLWIETEEPFDLQKNPENIQMFFDTIIDKSNEVLKLSVFEVGGDTYTYDELANFVSGIQRLLECGFQAKNTSGRYKTILNPTYDTKMRSKIVVSYDGKTEDEIRGFYKEIHRIYHDADQYTKESKDNYDKIKRFCNKFREITEDFITGDLKMWVDNYFPELSVHDGQKTSKIVRKFFDQFPDITGIKGTKEEVVMDENGEHTTRTKTINVFEIAFAKYSDSINPVAAKRKVIFSINPIDFLTESFGVNWSSCHTIDKQNLRHVDSSHNYQGMNCGGCVSYMNDSCSIVMYTVDGKYKGKEFCFESKIQRNIFFVGKDYFVQSRQYPDGRDGGQKSLAEQFRKYFIKMLGDCTELENTNTKWKKVSGSNECSNVATDYQGAFHYPDYRNASECSVSYYKYTSSKTAKVNAKDKIVVGYTAFSMVDGTPLEKKDRLDNKGCED